MTDEQVFDRAILVEVEKRGEFLDGVCATSRQRGRVAALLDAHDRSDDLLDTDVMALDQDTALEPMVRNTIGDFDIIRELGRGGMGVVYEARQKSLKRKVALKVLSSGLGLSSKAILRFRREAEAAGKLHHTNIVPIYTTGEDRGIHFYAMELIDGPSLDAVIRGLRAETETHDGCSASDESAGLPAWVKETVLFNGPKSETAAKVSAKSELPLVTETARSSIASGSGYFDQVATMVAEVADALDHAHEHGVIHRDIKPSNLLLGPDGRLSVNDFGLARMLEQPGMTMSGEFVGSPLYMSPEQVTAGRVTIDHRTDIYSLGATLYELLALQPPFPGQTRDQVLGQILQKDATAPRKINRKIPIDLDTICMKALEKDPEQRYQTARTLAEDLRKYVNRHAISARRIGPIGRAVKFVRRRPAIAALLLAFLCFAAVVIHLRQKNLRISKRYQAEIATTALELSKDRFVESVFAGDLEKAKLQLARAKTQGADEGWLSLSRALIEFHSGDHESAKEFLNDARSLGGSSLAIISLRIILDFETGAEASYMREASALKSRRVASIEDLFYFGVALKWADPWEALGSLNEAYKRRRSMHAIRLHRSFAAWQCAMDCPKPDRALELIEVAIKDGTFLAAQHPEDQYARAILVQAYLTEANIYQDLNREDDYVRSLETAETELSKIEEFPTEMEPIFARYLFLQHCGKHSEAYQYIIDSLKSAKGAVNYVAAYCSIAEFCRGNVAAAVRALDRMHEDERRLKESSRAMAELGAEPDARQRQDLLIGFREYLKGKGKTGDYTQFEQDWMVLGLLGDLETAREHSRKAGDYFRGFANANQKNLGPISDFLAGDSLDAQQLVKRCDTSKRTLATAYFAIAIESLVKGDRRSAIAGFEQCVSQDVYQFYVHQWSVALLKKLERNPDWPSWVPADTKSRGGAESPKTVRMED